MMRLSGRYSFHLILRLTGSMLMRGMMFHHHSLTPESSQHRCCDFSSCCERIQRKSFWRVSASLSEVQLPHFLSQHSMGRPSRFLKHSTLLKKMYSIESFPSAGLRCRNRTHLHLHHLPLRSWTCDQIEEQYWRLCAF